MISHLGAPELPALMELRCQWMFCTYITQSTKFIMANNVFLINANVKLLNLQAFLRKFALR